MVKILWVYQKINVVINQVDMLKTAQQMEDEPLVSTEQKSPSNKIGQNNKNIWELRKKYY